MIMKQAFIILGHKNPKQIKRLVSALNNPRFVFLIHIDARVPIEPFEQELGTKETNILFAKNRKHGRWGGIGIVKATLECLRQLTGMDNDNEFTHVSVLSGQDYPVKSKEYIHDFFNKNRNSDFIGFEPFPLKHTGYGGMERIQHYSFNLFGKRHTYLPKQYCKNLSLKGKIMNKFLYILEKILPKRKIPYGLKPYYGSQWWSLTRETVMQVLTFLDEHPEYEKYHSFSLLPDEMFFQTIVVELRQSEVDLVNENLRYIIWEKDSSHPVSLTTENFSDIAKTNALFARKFDAECLVLDLIDVKINE